MKRFFSILGALLIGFFALPEGGQAQKISSKAKIGDRYFEHEEYFLAAQNYKKALNRDKEDKYAAYKLGLAYMNYYDYKNAEKAFSKLLEMEGAKEEYPLAEYYAAVLLKHNGKYKEAKTALEDFIANFEPDTSNPKHRDKLQQAKIELKGAKLALRQFKKPARDYGFKLLPEPVNTENIEYAPHVFEHDTSIIITSQRPGAKGGNKDPRYGQVFSDNFRFHKVGDEWVENKKDDNFDKLNTILNDGAGVLAPDESYMIYTSCYVGDVCQLYRSDRDENGNWLPPEPLPETVNMPGEAAKQPTLSENGDTLFFVSDRPGGKGQNDIYYSVKGSDGEWKQAKNLRELNTPYHDVSPFYYGRDNVLFFSTNGRQGFGGLDIYMAHLDDFSNIVNAGLPFNSNRDDFYFTTGDQIGYLASNRSGGIGHDDIYTFSLIPKDAKITSVSKDNIEQYRSVSITAKLYKDDGGPASDVEVEVESQDGKVRKTTRSSKEGDVAFQNLPADTGYDVKVNQRSANISGRKDLSKDEVELIETGKPFAVNKSGKVVATYDEEGEPTKPYDPQGNPQEVYTASGAPVEVDEDKTKKITKQATPSVTNQSDIVVEDVKVKGSKAKPSRVHFENVYFNFDKSKLRPEAIKVLDELARHVQKNPGTQIEINGATDNIGSNSYNAKLSRRRANAARNYLLSRGVNSTQIVTNALGEGQPLASNENPVGRQLNRRVEFYIVGEGSYTSKGMTYVVPNATSLDEVAEKFGMSADQVRKMNNLEEDQVNAYQPLRVRRNDAGEAIAPITMMAAKKSEPDNVPELEGKSYNPSESSGASSSFNPGPLKEGQEYHTIQQGETLYSISRQYNMTLNELTAINNLSKGSTIYPGQKLKVQPKEVEPGSTADGRYVVREGDTMYGIAEKFGMTPEELKELNNLDSFMLYEHMVLKVK